jgi:hypothetical protein
MLWISLTGLGAHLLGYTAICKGVSRTESYNNRLHRLADFRPFGLPRCAEVPFSCETTVTDMFSRKPRNGTVEKHLDVSMVISYDEKWKAPTESPTSSPTAGGPSRVQTTTRLDTVADEVTLEYYPMREQSPVPEGSGQRVAQRPTLKEVNSSCTHHHSWSA